VTGQIALFAITLLAAAGMTGMVRNHAIRQRWLDHPNERSSHVQATPRGGGLAIVVAATCAFAIAALCHWIDPSLAGALIGGGLAVAGIGFFDDRQSASVSVRMLVHAAAAIWGIYSMGGVGPVQVGSDLVDMGWLGDVLGVFAIIWVLNLFNFMDGIDGIAASEAVFIALAGAGLQWLFGGSTGVSVASLIVAMAALGFLLWNWPPARIFMGDVGSGYLGYAVAVLTVAATRDNPVALLVWLVLGGAFFCDATVTLARRLMRGERASEAHRTHAYQWQARKWGSHKRVTVALTVLNVIWLLPCALVMTYKPDWALPMLGVALAPLALLVGVLGAGRAESRSA
jgi:Fuc2NAc and GlcNAc transferase